MSSNFRRYAAYVICAVSVCGLLWVSTTMRRDIRVGNDGPGERSMWSDYSFLGRISDSPKEEQPPVSGRRSASFLILRRRHFKVICRRARKRHERLDTADVWDASAARTERGGQKAKVRTCVLFRCSIAYSRMLFRSGRAAALTTRKQAL